MDSHDRCQQVYDDSKKWWSSWLFLTRLCICSASMLRVSSALLLGGLPIGARVCYCRHTLYNWYGLAISLGYSSEEEGGISLVQMISTCLRGAHRKGGGASITWLLMEVDSNLKWIITSTLSLKVRWSIYSIAFTVDVPLFFSAGCIIGTQNTFDVRIYIFLTHQYMWYDLEMLYVPVYFVTNPDWKYSFHKFHIWAGLSSWLLTHYSDNRLHLVLKVL